MFDLHSYLKERAQLIERALKQSVEEPTGAAARLHEAMRYSLLAGGKRSAAGARAGVVRGGRR